MPALVKARASSAMALPRQKASESSKRGAEVMGGGKEVEELKSTAPSRKTKLGPPVNPWRALLTHCRAGTPRRGMAGEAPLPPKSRRLAFSDTLSRATKEDACREMGRLALQMGKEERGPPCSRGTPRLTTEAGKKGQLESADWK